MKRLFLAPLWAALVLSAANACAPTRSIDAAVPHGPTGVQQRHTSGGPTHGASNEVTRENDNRQIVATDGCAPAMNPCSCRWQCGPSDENTECARQCSPEELGAEPPVCELRAGACRETPRTAEADDPRTICPAPRTETRAFDGDTCWLASDEVVAEQACVEDFNDKARARAVSAAGLTPLDVEPTPQRSVGDIGKVVPGWNNVGEAVIAGKYVGYAAPVPKTLGSVLATNDHAVVFLVVFESQVVASRARPICACGGGRGFPPGGGVFSYALPKGARYGGVKTVNHATISLTSYSNGRHPDTGKHCIPLVP